MASPKISVRLDNDTYGNLLKLAQIERKTITELVRELIEQGLKAKNPAGQEPNQGAVMQRLDVLEMHIGELLVKAVKAGASAQFLSRLAVAFGSDTVSWLTEQRLADGQSKAKFLADMEGQAERYAQEYLVKPE
jgi:plasmid maintenance system antidote protein VapI